MAFAPETTALCVIDMQRDFCDPDGSLYAPASERVVEPVAELLDSAREAGVSVVFTRDVHPAEQFERNHAYDEFERWGEHVLEGTEGTEIVAALAPEENDPNEHVVTKHTYDAFYETELEGWLRAHGIDDLVFCGTLANVCVLHTAGSAGLRDFGTVLVSDAIGYIEESHHEYALDHADWLFGERVERGEIAFER